MSTQKWILNDLSVRLGDYVEFYFSDNGKSVRIGDAKSLGIVDGHTHTKPPLILWDRIDEMKAKHPDSKPEAIIQSCYKDHPELPRE